MSGVALPEEAWVAALAGLPEMGPARLRALVGERGPEAAWRAVADGSWRRTADPAVFGADREGLGVRWCAAADSIDVEQVWARHVEAGVGVTVLGGPGFPAALADDVEPPAVVFTQGDRAAIAGPRVAVVGTRSATRYGIEVANELGEQLSGAGVAVVSGLALGIDGSAHAGALAGGGAPPIGVVGSGLDVIYPREHRALWRAVAERGVVLSEVPLGVRPSRWRFPARNRIIAALADVVVVVESQVTGGSMHTVNEALRRGRTVMAVPGPVRSPASSGTNRLLGEGAVPACDADDVLLALGLSSGAERRRRDARPEPTAADREVLRALGWQPASLDRLVLATGRAIDDLALALARLEAAGWVSERGGWYEQVARVDG